MTTFSSTFNHPFRYQIQNQQNEFRKHKKNISCYSVNFILGSLMRDKSEIQHASLINTLYYQLNKKQMSQLLDTHTQEKSQQDKKIQQLKKRREHLLTFRRQRQEIKDEEQYSSQELFEILEMNREENRFKDPFQMSRYNRLAGFILDELERRKIAALKRKTAAIMEKLKKDKEEKERKHLQRKRKELEKRKMIEKTQTPKKIALEKKKSKNQQKKQVKFEKEEEQTSANEQFFLQDDSDEEALISGQKVEKKEEEQGFFSKFFNFIGGKKEKVL